MTTPRAGSSGACRARSARPRTRTRAETGAGGADSVDPEHVREVYLALRKRSDGVLVEGPSGLLAPLGDGRTTADLAQVLGLPLVIVCRPGRGTVNHTALTLEAAERRKLAVRGLIVNGASEEPGLEELANRAELARLAPILEIVRDDTLSLSRLDVIHQRSGGTARRGRRWRRDRPAAPACARARRPAGGSGTR